MHRSTGRTFVDYSFCLLCLSSIGWIPGIAQSQASERLPFSQVAAAEQQALGQSKQPLGTKQFHLTKDTEKKELMRVDFGTPTKKTIYSPENLDLSYFVDTGRGLGFSFAVADEVDAVNVLAVKGDVLITLTPPQAMSQDTGAPRYSGIIRYKSEDYKSTDFSPYEIVFSMQIGKSTAQFSVSGLAARGSTAWPSRLVNGGRYFRQSDMGPAIYLTGSHTWDNLQDWGDGRSDFIYECPNGQANCTSYLDLMQSHGHNFMRLWVWESTKIGDPNLPNEDITPLPWQNNGTADNPDFDFYTGTLDINNLPSFDDFYAQVKFNQAYFTRLAERVADAGARGIYVSVMLYQGFSYYQKHFLDWCPWDFHPFNSVNNSDAMDGDLNHNANDGTCINPGDGEELHTLDFNQPSGGMEQALVYFQRAYIRKVVETLANFDNVLYEISNEDICSPSNYPGFCSKDWQYAAINYIKSLLVVEGPDGSTQTIAHPVGMTVYGQNGPNADVFNSPADWVSPGYGGSCSQTSGGGYAFDPPQDNQNKVIISDSDHIRCVLGSTDRHLYRQWIWKSMTRGLNPILMDAVQNPIGTPPGGNNPEWENGTDPNNPAFPFARTYQGQARAFAQRFDLTTTQVQADGTGDPASVGFSLYRPGLQYLVYQPSAASFTINLQPGTYQVEWFNPRSAALSATSLSLDQLIEANSYATGSVQVNSAGAVTFGAGAQQRPFGCDGGNSPFRCDAVLYLEAEAPLPDLRILNASATPDSNPSLFNLSYEVQNNGLGEAGGSITEVYLSVDAVLNSDDDESLLRLAVPALTAGVSDDGNTQVSIPDGLAGNYYLLVVTDSDNTVNETNESNNLAAVPVSIDTTIPVAPDLVIQNASNNVTIEPGGNLPVQCYVANIGVNAQTAGASVLAFYLSEDGVLSSDDQLLGQNAVGTINAGASSQQNASLTVPAGLPAGQYYIIYLADAQQQVMESNENNNHGQAAFVVSEQPPTGEPSTVPNFVGRYNGQDVDGLEIADLTPQIDFSWGHASHASGIQRYHIVLQPTTGPFFQTKTVFYPDTSYSMEANELEAGRTYSIHIKARSNTDIWGPYINGGVFTVVTPETVIAEDGFSGVNAGQVVAGRVIPGSAGGLVWNSKTNTVFGQNNITGSGNTIANIDFSPADFDYRPASVSADLNPTSDNGWTAVGYQKNRLHGWWADGQVWAYIKPNGMFNVLAYGNAVSLAGGVTDIPPEANFNPGADNHLELTYDALNQQAQFAINGVVVMPWTVVPVHPTDGSITSPEIYYAGWAALRAIQNQTTLDNFKLTVR